jgi:hypothetical protein
LYTELFSGAKTPPLTALGDPSKIQPRISGPAARSSENAVLEAMRSCYAAERVARFSQWWIFLLAIGCQKKALPEPATDRSDGVLPELEVVQVASGRIAIDGRLDDPGWQEAQSTGLFVQPGDGKQAPRSRANASARLAWDETHLYLGFVVYDPEPYSPFSRSEVDPHIWEKASGIELMLQPGDLGDNRDYYELQVDIGGALWDTRFDDYNKPIVDRPEGRLFGHQAWQSGARRAAARDEPGGKYTLELSLPWKSLTSSRVPVPPRPGDVWRANLYSFRDGQGDAMAWSPILGQGNFHKAARFGRLRFAALTSAR